MKYIRNPRGRIRSRIWIIGTLLCLLALIVGAQSGQAKAFWKESPGKNGSGNKVGLPELADLADELKKTVVNVRVMKKVETEQGPFFFHKGPKGEQEPFEDFFDQFQRFFGDRMPKKFERNSLGSGVIISADGYILSNNHVVGEADEIVVKLSDEEEFEGKVVGRDKELDLALLKIDAEDLPVAVLGDSDKLRVGDWVVAIGNPFGFEHTVTAGITSAKGRVLGSGAYDNFIQTDASINPGNSGGPLFNLDGEVVGINTAIVASGTGIGFAIPINQAKAVLTQLREKGSVTRGWLGVQIQPLDQGLAEKFELKELKGALVVGVMKGDPAEKAGVKQGDVIIEVDGVKIGNTKELLNTVAKLLPGNKVDIVVIRDGKEKTLTVTLGERPTDVMAAKEEPFEEKEQKEDRLGLTVQEVSPEIAEEFGLDEPKGVLVADVRPGSPADEAGVRRGDVIHEMEKTPISNLKDYEEVISDKKIKSFLTWLQRGKNRMYLVIKLED